MTTARLQKEMAVPPNKKREPAIDEYLTTVIAEHRAMLQALRKTIHIVIPEVEECISYRLPAFRLQGRIIAGFSATSKGCSYYPFSGTTLKTLAGEIKSYSHTKSALHFGPKGTAARRARAEAAEGAHRRRGAPSTRTGVGAEMEKSSYDGATPSIAGAA